MMTSPVVSPCLGVIQGLLLLLTVCAVNTWALKVTPEPVGPPSSSCPREIFYRTPSSTNDRRRSHNALGFDLKLVRRREVARQELYRVGEEREDLRQRTERFDESGRRSHSLDYTEIRRHSTDQRPSLNEDDGKRETSRHDETVSEKRERATRTRENVRLRRQVSPEPYSRIRNAEERRRHQRIVREVRSERESVSRASHDSSRTSRQSASERENRRERRALDRTTETGPTNPDRLSRKDERFSTDSKRDRSDTETRNYDSELEKRSVASRKLSSRARENFEREQESSARSRQGRSSELQQRSRAKNTRQEIGSEKFRGMNSRDYDSRRVDLGLQRSRRVSEEQSDLRNEVVMLETVQSRRGVQTRRGEILSSPRKSAAEQSSVRRNDERRATINRISESGRREAWQNARERLADPERRMEESVAGRVSQRNAEQRNSLRVETRRRTQSEPSDRRINRESSGQRIDRKNSLNEGLRRFRAEHDFEENERTLRRRLESRRDREIIAQRRLLNGRRYRESRREPVNAGFAGSENDLESRHENKRSTPESLDFHGRAEFRQVQSALGRGVRQRTSMEESRNRIDRRIVRKENVARRTEEQRLERMGEADSQSRTRQIRRQNTRASLEPANERSDDHSGRRTALSESTDMSQIGARRVDERGDLRLRVRTVRREETRRERGNEHDEPIVRNIGRQRKDGTLGRTQRNQSRRIRSTDGVEYNHEREEFPDRGSHSIRERESTEPGFNFERNQTRFRDTKERSLRTSEVGRKSGERQHSGPNSVDRRTSEETREWDRSRSLTLRTADKSNRGLSYIVREESLSRNPDFRRLKNTNALDNSRTVLDSRDTIASAERRRDAIDLNNKVVVRNPVSRSRQMESEQIPSRKLIETVSGDNAKAVVENDAIMKLLHLIKDVIILSCLVLPLTNYMDGKRAGHNGEKIGNGNHNNWSMGVLPKADSWSRTLLHRLWTPRTQTSVH